MHVTRVTHDPTVFSKTFFPRVIRFCSRGFKVTQPLIGKSEVVLITIKSTKFLRISPRVFLTLIELFTTTVASLASVDQDQAAQNVQPDL